ncbi:hypothetical protein Sru01_28990 [Sphaerisporangium rufum]|uniref:Protein kinase domain-containing protein n=2 Tax=Sphaerisporangium rufum TaxID=1381558 RepID=A0A919R692_9ACTN|nr:hypothetical protein Sru01_28990 [Sphaerisporangium rufum]
MGTVYLGTAPGGRPVAVKVVRRRHAEDGGFAARFRAEVANARRVASFCTAAVVDDGVADDGRPYLVTEYIAGTPLSAQIGEHGPLPGSALVGLAFGVCAALAAIHAAGLVHRDLKPGNVILSLTGPRVIDFGIARALDAATGPTLTGEVVGTPGWWAPEQIDGRPVTPATDVFAWGCLVAYAGNGRHPFGAGGAMAVAYRIMHEEPDLGGLPASLEPLVRRAVHRDPAARPTARELLLALIGGADAEEPATRVLEAMWEPPGNLHAAAAGTEPAAPAPAVPEQRPRRGRRRLAWTAGLLALVVLVGGGVLALSLWQRAGRRPPAVQAGPDRADDIGRRIITGDLQILLPAAPRCGLPAYQAGRRLADRQTCLASWFVLNLGAAPVRLAGLPDLVDDRHERHPATRAGRPAGLPMLGGTAPAGPDASIDVQPGQVLPFTGEYVLPAGRTPAALSGALLSGAAPVEVRL